MNAKTVAEANVIIVRFCDIFIFVIIGKNKKSANAWNRLKAVLNTNTIETVQINIYTCLAD